MLVECKQCGAPLDVAPNAAIVQCSYCGASNRVRSMKTLAQVAPPGWQPPTQWRNSFVPNAAPLPFRAPPKQVGVQHLVWIIFAVILVTTLCPLVFVPFFFIPFFNF